VHINGNHFQPLQHTCALLITALTWPEVTCLAGFLCHSCRPGRRSTPACKPFTALHSVARVCSGAGQRGQQGSVADRWLSHWLVCGAPYAGCCEQLTVGLFFAGCKSVCLIGGKRGGRAGACSACCNIMIIDGVLWMVCARLSPFSTVECGNVRFYFCETPIKGHHVQDIKPSHSSIIRG